jgi:hypothetical protein
MEDAKQTCIQQAIADPEVGRLGGAVITSKQGTYAYFAGKDPKNMKLGNDKDQTIVARIFKNESGNWTQADSQGREQELLPAHQTDSS